MPKLAFNISSLKNLARSTHKDLAQAAAVAAKSGAKAIVLGWHKAADAQDEKEAAAIKKSVKLPLHVELGLSEINFDAVLRLRPKSVCFAAEADVKNGDFASIEIDEENAGIVKNAVAALGKEGIAVSVSLAPNAHAIRAAKRLGAACVHLSTLRYVVLKNKTSRASELEDLNVSARLVRELDMRLHAGGGLDYGTIGPIGAISEVDVIEVGPAIAKRSVRVGLEQAVKEMQEALSGPSLPHLPAFLTDM